MPVHDWTRVHPDIFHAFHVGWVPEVSRALNGGLLPDTHYSLIELHVGRPIADVLARPSMPGAPPATRSDDDQPLGIARRRSLAIRHVSGHRLIALVEIVSPANKDRSQNVTEFADKVASALEAGVHVLVIDLFPPGRHDPAGLHGAILQRLARADEPAADDAPPANEPLTLAAYAGGRQVDAYVEYVAVGADLPDTPLFLHPERYVSVPLERTYQAAFSGMPAFWRDVLEGRPPAFR